ncbi:MAG: hypothetical protein EBY70_04040 [Burkholderiaceae bacterium]|nr:hypothetical protein [Burkholderiaceae bacterium]
MPYKILLLGASYGSLLASKLLYGGHHIHLVCLPEEAKLINAEGFKVRLPIRGRAEPVLLNSQQLPGSVSAGPAETVDVSQYDLVGLCMQEPQYRLSGVRELMMAIGQSRLPCMSIMNMPPLPYMKRIAGLDHAALEAAYTDISNFNDDRGLPMMAKPKKIVVSTSDALVTRKILGTAYAVGSNNNDVNVVSTDYQNVELVVNPYLTDTDAWFVLTDVENGVLYIESIKPEPDKDMVFDSKDLKFTVHGGFSVVTADPRAVWGSPGA